jgi:hypothetical protein
MNELKELGRDRTRQYCCDRGTRRFRINSDGRREEMKDLVAPASIILFFTVPVKEEGRTSPNNQNDLFPRLSSSYAID